MQLALSHLQRLVLPVPSIRLPEHNQKPAEAPIEAFQAYLSVALEMGLSGTEYLAGTCTSKLCCACLRASSQLHAVLHVARHLSSTPRLCLLVGIERKQQRPKPFAGPLASLCIVRLILGCCDMMGSAADRRVPLCLLIVIHTVSGYFFGGVAWHAMACRSNTMDRTHCAFWPDPIQFARIRRSPTFSFATTCVASISMSGDDWFLRPKSRQFPLWY